MTKSLSLSLAMAEGIPVTEEPRKARTTLWLRVQAGLALLFFFIGLAGAFLPLIPTTVFWIIACVFAFRASPKLRQRMMEHRTYGPGLQLWFEHGAIGRCSKTIAVLSMVVSGLVTTALMWGKLIVLLIIWGCLAGVALWMITRPEGSKEKGSED